MAAWEDFQAEILQAVPLGDHVIVELCQRGHGRDTGMELEQTDWHVFTVLDGRIVRWRDYWTRAEALEAVGLRE